MTSLIPQADLNTLQEIITDMDVLLARLNEVLGAQQVDPEIAKLMNNPMVKLIDSIVIK